MRVLKNILINCCILFQQTSSYANTEKQTFESQAKRYTASYLECDQLAIDDSLRLEEALSLAVKELDGEAVISSHHFNSGGLSAVVLVQGGHICIHSYPKYQSCFVDFFVPKQVCDWKKIDANLQEYLMPKAANIQVVIRD